MASLNPKLGRVVFSVRKLFGTFTYPRLKIDVFLIEWQLATFMMFISIFDGTNITIFHHIGFIQYMLEHS